MMTILQSGSYESMNPDAAVGLLMSGGVLIFMLLLYLFFSFCLYKIFQKANYENPIAAFVPVWNTIALADIVKKEWWWGILMVIPYVNIIAFIFIYLRLSKFFGKGDGFAVGLILVGFIFLPILAFGDAVYNPNALPDDRNK